jgi:hypothetical protein
MLTISRLRHDTEWEQGAEGDDPGMLFQEMPKPLLLKGGRPIGVDTFSIAGD